MYIFGGSTGGALEDFHSLNLETYTWAPVCVANSTPNYFSFPGSRTNRAQEIFMSSSATFTSSSCVDDALRGPIIRIGTGMNAWSMPNISPDISIEVRRTGSPGNRFCHIAVVHCGSIYSFGGYDGSKRLNDFLKFSLTPDNLIVGVPSSTLVEDLRGFVGSDFQSDVTFIVEGKRVRAHKILCMRCPYFRNMFRGEYVESREEEVIISEVGYETFFKLLEFLYSDHCEVNSINVVDLFQAADRFGVERLKKICESALINLLDVDSVCDIFLLGDSYNGELLKSESIAFIVTHFDQVSRSAGFEEMARENMDVLFQILRLR